MSMKNGKKHAKLIWRFRIPPAKTFLGKMVICMVRGVT